MTAESYADFTSFDGGTIHNATTFGQSSTVAEGTETLQFTSTTDAVSSDLSGPEPTIDLGTFSLLNPTGSGAFTGDTVSLNFLQTAPATLNGGGVMTTITGSIKYKVNGSTGALYIDFGDPTVPLTDASGNTYYYEFDNPVGVKVGSTGDVIADLSTSLVQPGSIVPLPKTAWAGMLVLGLIGLPRSRYRKTVA